MIYKPLTTLAVVLGTLGVAPTEAAENELKPECGWGPNPTNLELHVYEPPKLADRPAVILAVRDNLTRKRTRRQS